MKKANRRAWALLLAVLPELASAQPAPVRWRDVLKQDAKWYGSPEARRIADAVLRFQHPSGGWSKNTDMAAPHTEQEMEALTKDNDTERSATIDNDATYTQLRFLARVIEARDDKLYREAFLRGFDYLLAAQYENGGWPQFYPLRKGYYSRITFNDDAMIGTMSLLRDAAAGHASFGFVDKERRAKAARAVEKGIACTLRCQVVVDGRRTVWCAQHDEQTFAPAWARAYEPPSLSGFESVNVVRFLMEIDKPSPEIVAAIEGAVAWFKAVPMHGQRIETFTAEDGQRDRRMIKDPQAPPQWARFYEIGANKPIYMGRDSVPRDDYNAIERERRAGYNYAGTWPAALLEVEYPAWAAKRAKQN